MPKMIRTGLPGILQVIVSALTVVLLGMDLHSKIKERREEKRKDKA